MIFCTSRERVGFTLARDIAWQVVSLKSLLLFGHHVRADFVAGSLIADNWICCNCGAQDAAMLIGLRRRLQDLLGNRIGSVGELDEEDRDLINAVTTTLVLDVE